MQTNATKLQMVRKTCNARRDYMSNKDIASTISMWNYDMCVECAMKVLHATSIDKLSWSASDWIEIGTDKQGLYGREEKELWKPLLWAILAWEQITEGLCCAFFRNKNPENCTFEIDISENLASAPPSWDFIVSHFGMRANYWGSLLCFLWNKNLENCTFKWYRHLRKSSICTPCWRQIYFA